MENLSARESFKSFRVSNHVMSKISGARSKSFERDADGSEVCLKVIDQGGEIKKKHKLRFNNRCS